MRARYIGDPRHDGHGPGTVEVFGLSFRKGEWVSIDGNAAAMRKLPGNSHFEVDAGTVKAARPAPAPKAAPASPPAAPPPAPDAQSADAIPADWAKAHHMKRMGWARAVSGGEVATVAVADAILTAHFAPKDAPLAEKPDDDDGFSDLDPE